MPTYPLATLAASITSAGITAPAYPDILGSLTASFQSIYGSDALLTPDTIDGQLLAIFAKIINDGNQTDIATYNSFNPSFAQGAGLAALVKINGIQKQTASSSTVAVTITGVAGTVIGTDGPPSAYGKVQDTSGNIWDFLETVTIPSGGTVTATAYCETAGQVLISPGAVNVIYTPTRGWQSVTNAGGSVGGAAVETDAALRERQTISTSLPSTTPLQAIQSAVANVAGVSRVQIYQNDESITDGNGVPGHSISTVVGGGDITAIAQTIESKKSPGTGTYGSTSVVVTDPSGVPVQINFFELAEVRIYAAVTIATFNGYTAATGVDIVNSIVNFINDLAIGDDVYYNWVLGAAGQTNLPEGLTYRVTALTIGYSAGALSTADLSIAFNAAAVSVAGNVILTVS